MRREIRSLFFAGILSASLAFSQGPPAWTPEFSMEFQTIGSVAPSPDGKWVTWTQVRAVMDSERSEHVSQVWAAKADGSQRLQLTRSQKSSTNPAWSPDGKWIYFQSPRFGKNDMFRIPLEGGEAEQLTKVTGGVKVFSVSKDGRWLAYTSAELDPDEEKAIKEKRDLHVVDAKPKNALLYVLPAEASNSPKPRALTTADRHVQEVAWSPDGAKIAFVYWATPMVNEWRKGKLAEADIATGDVKEIAAVETFGAAPAYSPDGRFLAFQQRSAPVPYPGASRMALYDRKSGAVRQLAATPNEQSRLAGWRPDSRGIVVSEAKGTTTVLLEVSIDGPAKQVFAPKSGILTQATMNDAGNQIGIAHESSDQAPEVFVLAPDGKAMQQVSAANSAMAHPPLGRTEVVRWPSKDGKEIEGLLTYPVNYQPGTKVPLILNIHGGPAGGFNQDFIGRAGLYPIGVFAARGYAVLRPNPRGSTGYGKEFRYSNFSDWGGKDYEDDQSGVDMLIAKGIVDPNRMAVVGWSYGGYMTSWTIGQTTRFKAAAVGAGVIDLMSFTGTTDIADFLPDYFGGDFWKQPELYKKHSPITYVGNVTTPTLVLHGEADERVPTSQGFEYYHALQRRGVPTQMVTYPRTPHGPEEPKFILDIMQRHVAWVDKYLQ
jgi:dipeptidyl aminopeptidase/acylaminoacyl peptidase